MTKFTVLAGFNVPNPSGKRLANGRPEELRFEPGATITESDVPEKSLRALLEAKAIAPEPAVEMPDQPAPPPAAAAAAEGENANAAHKPSKAKK